MTIDAERFITGNESRAYGYLGCEFKGETAVFTVWAPKADRVKLTGDFCDWKGLDMVRTGEFWRIETKANLGDRYKYEITGDNGTRLKADPFAFYNETEGKTASIVFDKAAIKVNDEKYQRQKKAPYHRPVNIYEVHIGSWRRDNGAYYNYRRFADECARYMRDCGYNYIELIGISEHPFDRSWGYQVTGYFSPTARYGTPLDFAYMVEKFHSFGIGVILDWVPGHFPKDEFGLIEFDGGNLFELDDELMKEHREWGTRCFDYGKGGVRSFLISSAMMWFDVYHIDGLRVDAVASMLYLDYDRKEFHPNIYGGNYNLEAINFLRQLNSSVFAAHSDALMIAEESTAFPLVTGRTDKGGLGFNYKWNMGWMNDTLDYISYEPIYRQYHHDKLTFSMTYAFSENYILPISHDEVVYGKGTLLSRQKGNYEQKFAGFRQTLAYMYAFPGKKLVMMGTENATFDEWDYSKELFRGILDYPEHAKSAEFVKSLNKLYLHTAALYSLDDSWKGFEWVVVDDNKANVIAFIRKDKRGGRLLAIFNFSPVARDKYYFPLDCECELIPVLKSAEGVTRPDDVVYGTIKERDGRDYLVYDLGSFEASYFKIKKAPLKRRVK